jgi:hypothetical protein
VDLKRLLTASRLKKNLYAAVLLVLPVLAILSFWFWNGARFSLHHFVPVDAPDPPPTSSFWLFDVAQFGNFAGQDFLSSRPVYPYSVIPGGVVNAKELNAAMRQDPVIAGHYADFRMRSTHPVRLTAARRVYVSYRLGNRIYWTRKKVTLHVGETLLTDGVHLARVRCGNRISEVPAGPVSPSEPPVEVFDKPILPNLPVQTVDALPGAPIWGDTPPILQVTLNQPPQFGVPFIPLIPIFPCCGGSGGPSPSPNPSPPPQPAPPVATPEPASIVLLLIGFCGLLCLCKFLCS